MRILSVAVLGVAVALSVVSTTFVYLALRSSEWSTQSYYFAINGQSDGTTDITPNCTATRSPFYRCGIPAVDENGTCTIEACGFYMPHGTNSTSCRSSAEMGIPGNDNLAAAGLLGGDQECQQVHYAGNLQIAATIFITLALLSGLSAFVVSIVPRRAVSEATPGAERGKEQQGPGNHDHPPPSRRRPTLGSSSISVFLACLYAGALLQVLAQFFGVLGLTVNATPNAFGANADQYMAGLNNFVAHDWVIGKGLATYATVAWTTAFASALLTGAFFDARFPSLL